KWVEQPDLLKGLEFDKSILTSQDGRDRGVRCRDIDKDGLCEIMVGNDDQRGVLRWSEEKGSWLKLPFSLPSATNLVTGDGQDNGLRFVDLDEDGFDDMI